MDVSGMTLEGFFLADYERMRMRIIELEDTVKQLTPDGYGCVDQHKTCDAVNVTVDNPYKFSDTGYRGIDLPELRRAHAMTNDDLFEWATKEYRTTSYYSSLRPIEVKRHRFQYTLTINETRGCHVYVTDGKGGSELIEIDFMEKEMVDNLNKWCREEYLGELKIAALSELRSILESAIDKLESKEQECTD